MSATASGSANTRPDDPTRAEIEKCLNELVSSRTFAKSETLRKLIEFLVRAEIAGEALSITEARLATEVLNREQDFNPLEDSIVRKTMARLREKLGQYYTGEGRAAEVHFLFERGSYRPGVFRKEEGRTTPGFSNAPRVLLLPFYPINFHDEHFFTEGLFEDLMIALAAGGGVPLVPWTTARYLRELTGDMREYHRITRADVVLDGTVRQLGADIYQITVSWVEGITAVFDSYFQVRTRASDTTDAVRTLSKQITQRLGANFAPGAEVQIEARHSPDPQARTLYLRARQANRFGTHEGTRLSFAYLSRALDLQPNYAAAHALMADCHIYAAICGLGKPKVEMPLAIKSVQRALSLSPGLATALAAKGGTQFAFQWDFASATKTLSAARLLDPTSDTTHFWSESVLATQDPLAAAIRIEKHAEADNCSAATAYMACTHFYNARQWRQTELWARRSIELDPTYFRPYPFLAGACLELGRSEEALSYAETARRLSGPNPYSTGMLGIVLARTGQRTEARAVLDDYKSMCGFPSSIGKAVVWAELGDINQALDSIERMIEDREPYVAWLHIFPFFHKLRLLPRFQTLLSQKRDRVRRELP